MVEVRRSTIIDAPVDEVWQILRDFNGHARWHPAVVKSEIEGAQTPDMIGAVRDFRLKDGSRIHEQLLSLSDHDRSFRYCILEAPLPLMDYVATVTLKPVSDGDRTFWEWRSYFEPSPTERTRLVRLVAEEIYEAGFRAIKSLLTGGRARSLQRATAEDIARSSAPVSGASIETQAIMVAQFGGPEVLQLRMVRVPPPGPGEVRLRQHAIGVNYIDIYCRTGYFDLLTPPGIPGLEAAGIVESVGPDVVNFRPGDGVGYASPPIGSYAGARVMDASALIPLPGFLEEEMAAASLLKGITASLLLHDVHQLKRGETVLIHAAAGGVGLILCQWAAALGATVIGTASSEEKAARAREAGCRHVIRYDREDFVAKVAQLTDGNGVDVVYDAVGKSTFAGSIRSLAPRGHLVSFGQASGDIGAYEVGGLASRSVTLSRPNYGHYTDTSDKLRAHAEQFFSAVERGMIRLSPPTRYPLAEARRAHADLEQRRSSGSLILIP